MPHKAVPVNNIPVHAGLFALSPTKIFNRGWIVVGIKKQADEDNKDVVLQGSQALTQVLHMINPTFKLLVQHEGITLSPLHSTKDED